jgi:hypothetical protein
MDKQKQMLMQLAQMRAKLRVLGYADDVIIGLLKLRETQMTVSLPVPDAIPPEGELPTKDSVRTHVLALFVELAEFLQTLDWKSWKKDPKKLDQERICDEFADILAFLGVILIHLTAMGITPGMLGEAYRRKSIINIDRFTGQLGEEYHQDVLL